jgi:hypothetical protein
VIAVFALALTALLLRFSVGFRNDLPGWAFMIFLLTSAAALAALVCL